MIVANVHDFREAARRRLPHFLFEYIDGGSYQQVTLRRNIEDLEKVALRQRILRDVSRLENGSSSPTAEEIWPDSGRRCSSKPLHKRLERYQLGTTWVPNGYQSGTELG